MKGKLFLIKFKYLQIEHAGYQDARIPEYQDTRLPGN